MFYNYKIAIRNLLRGGVYSAINIGGLAIGMAATILIMLWVYNQWSYDRFHKKAKQLYKVWNYDEVNGTSDKVPHLIGPALLDEYAGFANMTRYQETEFSFMVDRENTADFSGEDHRIIVATVDPAFLQMFSFPLLQGDVATVLNDPFSVVMTETAAKRFFGEKDPINQVISLSEQIQFTVTGILADLPQNTGFNFEILVPIKAFLAGIDWWGTPLGSTYVELSPAMEEKAANSMIRNLVSEHTGGRLTAETFLQPASEWNLYSSFEKDKPVGGRIESLRMFTVIALLILFSACINFMNLSTARSSKNAKEVGVRKVLGASRYSLVNRFMFDSILVAAIAGVLAVIFVLICLPSFNALIGENIGLSLGGIRFWLVWILFILFTGILAGSYPSFYLSSFLPVKVLKGVFKGGKGLVTPRKILIVTQFTLAVMLIISTTVIYRQIYHAKTRDAGYDRTRLVSVMIDDYSRPNKELIRQELLNSGVAESVSINFGSMIKSESTFTDVSWRGKDPESKILIERNYAIADWAKTTGVEIIQGRDIDIRQHPSDSTAMLLNETAVRMMGFEDPIGEVIREFDKEYRVIGVVKDFVLGSPYDPVRPMIIGGPAHNFYNNINIKLNTHSGMAESINQIEQIFKKYGWGGLFLYHFADEEYARHFDKEQRIGSLIVWFTGLAIFISCLGLFGLSAYMAENRRKEIGIRKVLGASVFDITSLLSKEFLTLVTISLAIGMPVAWWAMNQWLSGYAYRTDLAWWIFIGAAVFTIVISLATVSVQAIKAATANPVKSIKTE